MFSSNRTVLDTQNRVIWATCFSVESIVITIGNLIAMVIFLKTKLHCKSNYLLVILTVADLCVGLATGLSAIPLILYNDGYKNGHYTIVNVSFICNIYTTFWSIIVLAFIAFERVYAILFPLKHRMFKDKDYYCAIGATVIISLVILFIIIGLEQVGAASSHESRHRVVNIFMIVVSFIILVLIGLSYVTIWIKIRFFVLRECNSSRKNKKLAKTAFIVTVVSFISWMPEGMIIAYEMFLCRSCPPKLSIHVYMFADVLLYGNSLVNLFVYAFRMPFFRNELSRIVGRKRNMSRYYDSRKSNVLRYTRTASSPMIRVKLQKKTSRL